VVKGDPRWARLHDVAPEVAGFATVLRRAQQLFVLGHEYGHLMAGHLEDARYRIGSEEVDAASRRWDQEFDADLVGIALAPSRFSLG
jgi:hypothetical protein